MSGLVSRVWSLMSNSPKPWHPKPRNRRARPPLLYSIPNLLGTLSHGSESVILACGGRLWVLARLSSKAEEVPDASRLNGGVRRNPPPPVKLRAGRGPGSCPVNGAAPKPQPPLSPARGGSGERNAVLFFAAPKVSSKVFPTILHEPPQPFHDSPRFSTIPLDSPRFSSIPLDSPRFPSILHEGPWSPEQPQPG